MSTFAPEVIEGITVDPVLSVLSPGFLKKNYLFGLDFVDKENEPVPTEFFVQKITTACALFKRLTQVNVLQTVITDERHDYHSDDYRQFCFLQLFEYPVVSVESVSAVYPTGQEIFTFPPEWFKLTKEHGHLQIVPTGGSLANVLLGRGGSYLPLVWSGQGYLPQLLRVAYTVGFDAKKVPWDIIDAIAKLAAIEVFTVMGLTITPVGVANISAGIDGLSQGMGFVGANGQTPGAFSGWIAAYKSDLYGDPRLGMRGAIKDLKDQYRALTLTSV